MASYEHAARESPIYAALREVAREGQARKPESISHLHRMVDYAEMRRAFFEQRRYHLFQFALAILTAGLAGLLLSFRQQPPDSDRFVLLGLAVLVVTGMTGVTTYFVQSLTYPFEETVGTRSWTFQRNVPRHIQRWKMRSLFKTQDVVDKSKEFGQWFFGKDRDDVLECLDLVLTLHIRSKAINHHVRVLRKIVAFGFSLSILFILTGLALTYFRS